MKRSNWEEHSSAVQLQQYICVLNKSHLLKSPWVRYHVDQCLKSHSNYVSQNSIVPLASWLASAGLGPFWPERPFSILTREKWIFKKSTLFKILYTKSGQHCVSMAAVVVLSEPVLVCSPYFIPTHRMSTVWAILADSLFKFVLYCFGSIQLFDTTRGGVEEVGESRMVST